MNFLGIMPVILASIWKVVVVVVAVVGDVARVRFLMVVRVRIACEVVSDHCDDAGRVVSCEEDGCGAGCGCSEVFGDDVVGFGCVLGT